jgi:hypothetical protein
MALSVVWVAPTAESSHAPIWIHSHLTITELEVLGEHVIKTQEFQQVRAIARACQGCTCQGRV